MQKSRRSGGWGSGVEGFRSGGGQGVCERRIEVILKMQKSWGPVGGSRWMCTRN